MNQKKTDNKRDLNLTYIRIIIFTAVAILHLLIILFAAFKMEVIINIPEPLAGVLKLVDVEERTPPPRPPVEPQRETNDVIAETMIATDEVIPPAEKPAEEYSSEQTEYLPQYRISVLPVLPENEIRSAIVYPPIARRSNIEGTVYLELFIDRYGQVREVRILRENPPGRGFGEAAVNAFMGIRGKPAEANGIAVAVRYRYNLTFKLN